jgi:hypothetical protein
MEGEGFGAEGRQGEAAVGRAQMAHWDDPGQYDFLCTFLDWQTKYAFLCAFFALCCVQMYCPKDLTTTMFVPKFMV